MIIVSDLINKYFLVKLKSKHYRKIIFEQALKNELRHKKLGKIILRNLNDMMNADTNIHNEFVEIVGKDAFQTKFWESDLGYLWFEGNANTDKPYFNTVVDLIKEKDLKTLLDVGCGWGIFCNKCAKETSISQVKGIDISEGVVNNAKQKFKSEKISFEMMDLLSVKENYDLVTIFGSIDYIAPAEIEKFVLKMLDVSTKYVVIVNSLRTMPIADYMQLQSSKEVKRYDVGYIHPIAIILEKHKANFNYSYTITKSGMDSALMILSK